MLHTIIAGLGWIGAALVFSAVAGGLLRAEWQDLWYWCSVAGLVCVSLYLLAQWRELLRLFERRHARYGSMAAASTLAALGILVSVNYIAAKQNRRWDLTAARQFTLSDQTVRILEALDDPMAIAVFGRDDDFDRFRSRLVEYEDVSPQISVRYIDIDKEPIETRQYDIQSYGTVVFEYGGRVERVIADKEQELTNALIKAVEGEAQTAYFVEGHGEKDIRSAERDGYNAVASALEADNFAVETIVLAQEADVPENAGVVIVAGPMTDFLPGEVDAVERYLDAGGKALFLVDPPATVDAAQLPNLSALLADWAIELGNDVVVDVSGMGQLLGTDASVPIAASYPDHPITERFSFITAFPLARSIAATPGGVGDRMAEPFVETSARSWAESDIDRLIDGGEVELQEDQGDRPGPIVIGLAVAAPVSVSTDPAAQTDAPAEADGPSDSEAPADSGAAESANPPDGSSGDADAPAREARVAVIGDSDFAANFGLGIQGNRDLFLNTVNWLAQQENLVAIRPREPEDRRITLTLDQQQRILWLSILFLPGVVFGAGVYSWWQRRD